MTASATTAVPAGIAPAVRRADPVPRRAEGVELLGELAGSGYRRPPALARRADGQLIKLTPLLYQLVGAIDGGRGYEQLAQELSTRIGKRATPGDVRYLVERKLRPLGLLQGADGTPQLVRTNPLLVLRPRIVVSKAEWTRRLVAPFVCLFNPLVVLPVLAGFTGLIWWLVADKGLASALHQAFFEPSMILVLWALIVLSAAFHEFGHAAACRYGGARPGVMGAGLYLVWPAFYTEVSDAYRLDRRGRLRVDLGGLYFNAIFSLAVAGAWALTGDDALLLVIAVQVVQMVRQLGPFIRADGYHIIGDLIGVPDLFSQIKTTLLGLLPTRWGRPENKELKPWAKAVVVVWVFTVVPLLLGILGYVVLMLPRLVATAWESMGLHWTQTTASWHQGDAAAVVQSAGETALVAMPILGIFYLLGRIARRSAGAMWRVTGGRPLQRSLAIAGAAGMLALVAWAWWPDHQYRPIQGDEAGPVPTILAPAPTPYPTYVQPTVVGIPAPAITSQTMVALIPSTPVDTLVTIIEEQAHSGARVAIPDEGGWPFPFDRPAPPGPGDNRAEAFNTSDDSFLSDIATALLIVTDGDPVRQGNEAYAFASCRDCTTIAIAMQVILIVGSSDEIIPINAAGALNYDCRRCATYASAYQLALSVAELPSGRILGEIGAVLDRVEHLPLRSISGDDIDAALEDAKNDMLDIVAQSVILAFQQSRADSQVASADDLDDGSAATDLSEPSTPPTATTARAAVRSTATSPTSSETTTATSDPEDSATNAAADDPTATTTTPTPNSTSDSTDPSTGG